MPSRLRQGEALGLWWQDVDLEAGTLTVRTALQRLDGELRLVQPKTPRSRRTIALPEIAARALRDHRARQVEERLLAGSRWQDWGLVFASTVATPQQPRNVMRHYHRALGRPGLPRLRFHELRHSAATLLLAQGIEPRVVRDVLGHSQIGPTANLYTHVMAVLKQEAARKMDAVLG